MKYFITLLFIFIYVVIHSKNYDCNCKGLTKTNITYNLNIKNTKFGLGSYFELRKRFLLFLDINYGWNEDKYYKEVPFTMYKRVGAICNSGFVSNSIGSGTCSNHGGVSQWIYDSYDIPTNQPNRVESYVNTFNFGGGVNIFERDFKSLGVSNYVRNNYKLFLLFGFGYTKTKIIKSYIYSSYFTDSTVRYDEPIVNRSFNYNITLLNNYNKFTLGFGYNHNPKGFILKLGINF